MQQSISEKLKQWKSINVDGKADGKASTASKNTSKITPKNISKDIKRVPPSALSAPQSSKADPTKSIPARLGTISTGTRTAANISTNRPISSRKLPVEYSNPLINNIEKQLKLGNTTKLEINTALSSPRSHVRSPNIREPDNKIINGKTSDSPPNMQGVSNNNRDTSSIRNSNPNNNVSNNSSPNRNKSGESSPNRSPKNGPNSPNNRGKNRNSSSPTSRGKSPNKLSSGSVDEDAPGK